MKNELITAEQQYLDPEIEALLDAFSAETLVLNLKGQQDGAANRPYSEAHWRTSVFNKLQHELQKVVATVQKKLQPIALVVIQKIIAADATEKIQAIQPAINSEKQKAFALFQSMQKNLPDKLTRRWRKIVHVCIAVLGLLDGYIAYEAFRSGKLSFLQSFLYGCGVLIILGLGSIFLADFALKARTKRLMRIRLYLGCAFAAIIFVLISYARADCYNNANHINLETGTTDISLPVTAHVSGVVLFGISFGFFVAALFFSIQVHKTKEEEAKEQAYNETKKQYDAIQCRIREMTYQIEAIEQDKQAKTALAIKIYEYAEGCKKRALGIAGKGLADYADENLAFRTDRQCPWYFSNPPGFTIISFLEQVKAA